MAKLNQILAIEKSVKPAAIGDLTALDKAAQKPALFSGFSRTYQPVDDQSDRFPDEKAIVQANAQDLLTTAKKVMTGLFEVEARKDWTNTVAKADVVVDGATIIPQAPVSFLLFLEKQLDNVHTLVSHIPVLDQAEVWTLDENAGVFKTEPAVTHKTKKVQKPIVLFPATPEHPAQTQLTTEDVIAGHWSQTKFSGGMRRSDKAALLERITKLSLAVKQAREAANNTDEVAVPIMSPVFDFILKS